MSGQNFKQGDFAEKSPGVHYANWKEDILLKKKLQTLDRTERNLVHRIKVDQKVLFKRFENKLHRSKLTRARLWGDKGTERELRSSNLHGLNVDIVNSEKDYEFLNQLENRPCITNGRPQIEAKLVPRNNGTVTKKKTKTVKQLDTIIHNVFQKPNVQATPRVRSKSFTEGLSSDNGTVSRSTNGLVQNNTLPVRPSTTSGARYDNVDIVIPGFQREMFKSQNNSETLKCKIKKLSKKGKSRVNFHNVRPQTCSPCMMNGNSLETGEVSPPRSRRQSLSRNASVDKSSRKSSLFEKEDKIDVTNILLDSLKSVDHTPRIKEFCEAIKDHCVTGSEHADYYTIRLQSAMKELHVPVSVPGTPKEEYKRHVGNLDVLSLTFKSLNFDFSRRDHTYTSSEAPDFAPIVYSSSDYSSDEDD